MNNPFADPNLEMKLAMDQRTREYMSDPSFCMMLSELKKDASKLSMWVLFYLIIITFVVIFFHLNLVINL